MVFIAKTIKLLVSTFSNVYNYFKSLLKRPHSQSCFQPHICTCHHLTQSEPLTITLKCVRRWLWLRWDIRPNVQELFSTVCITTGNQHKNSHFVLSQNLFIHKGILPGYPIKKVRAIRGLNFLDSVKPLNRFVSGPNGSITSWPPTFHRNGQSAHSW